MINILKFMITIVKIKSKFYLKYKENIYLFQNKINFKMLIKKFVEKKFIG